MLELSKEEINQRLVKLRNLERLYPIARHRLDLLEKENKALKLKLAEVVASYDAIIEKLKLWLEELERMVFGRRGKHNNEQKDNPEYNKDTNQSKNKQPRQPETCRRPIPKDDQITETNDYPIAHCPDCHTIVRTAKKECRACQFHPN